MRQPRRYAAFVAVLVAFGVGVALIDALLRDGPSVTRVTTGTVGALAKATRGVRARPQRAVPRTRPSVRSEDLGAHRLGRRVRLARRGAIRTFERFADSYLRYESGEVDDAVRRALRATATRSLALELLGAAPRVPPTLEAPAAASLAARVEATPLGAGRPSGAAKRFEVQGIARGSGTTERLAFVVARTEKGWRVKGPTGG